MTPVEQIYIYQVKAKKSQCTNENVLQKIHIKTKMFGFQK